MNLFNFLGPIVPPTFLFPFMVIALFVVGQATDIVGHIIGGNKSY